MLNLFNTNDEWMGSSNQGWSRNYYWYEGGDRGDYYYNWLPAVNGYDIKDYNYGFAGDYGKPVVALRINTGTYSVHETGGGWITASNNNPAGRGKPIDGVAIRGGVRYRVHILGGSWLDEVSKYDLSDGDYGYAGILGQTIDAVAINGKTYATGY